MTVENGGFAPNCRPHLRVGGGGAVGLTPAEQNYDIGNRELLNIKLSLGAGAVSPLG